ncbi:MAG: type I-C CRISPR-associated protein Cas8c/Csd1 [Desulfovibrio sp.]|jgi:CRISPR-associated protein Csd1|nr:type I-C CRISPR-associated protein Cas8c/Csd1 [Desulfovibrio sp.]
MILQSLNAYYERLAADSESGIALRGFSRQPVPFALEISDDGAVLQVLDLRDDSKKRNPAQLILPEPLKTSGAGFSANFMWDNTGYVLGIDTKGKPERSAKSFAAFRERLEEVGKDLKDTDTGFAAVCNFMVHWQPETAGRWPEWKDMAGRNLVFRLAGERCYVHDRPAVRRAWLTYYESVTSSIHGQCLVTGKTGSINPTHPKIQGVKDAQSTGASLVSFNADAFTSYGKDQSYNAPICEEAAFNYTTALNDLLRRGSRQRVQIGDATTVFWTKRKTLSESLFPFAFSQNEDQGDLSALRRFLEAVRDGKMPEEFQNEADDRTYVLGLSPNAGRISVRFWHVDTVAGMWKKIGSHFADLQIERQYENDPVFPPQWLLLKAAALREDLANLSPLLSGAFMRAILSGAAYPAALLAAVLERIRAEQNITYARAALLKACLVRNFRRRRQKQEVSVSLDEHTTNVPYRLGRLFAVLEKLQQEAVPGANSTIKDRYFGSASATPRAVFPVLLRLAQHHAAKIRYGYVYDKRISDILESIDIANGAFPAYLSLEDQGLFALGYYHQRNKLWTSQKTEPGITIDRGDNAAEEE